MYIITIQDSDGRTDCKECRFLQSPFWGEFKSRHGWKNRRFLVTADAENRPLLKFECSVLIRTFGKKPFRFSIAYIPMMPELPENDKTSVEQLESYSCLLIEFAAAIKKELPHNVLCVRYDPPIDFYTCEDRDFFVNSLKMLDFAGYFKLKKTKVDIQPPDTVIVDLLKPQDAILEAMKPKWRYNIRLAERKGVTVKKINADADDFNEYFDEFYDLFKTTAVRDGIAIHAKSYYSDLLKQSAVQLKENTDTPVLTLYIAEHEGDRLAGIITLFSKYESVYLYGASGNLKRNLMPAYLLQWNAICDAKAFGSKCYDMYGMPPTDDENHPMHGLYRFKTGFGGTVIHRPGSIDVPVHCMYKLYTALEDLRAFWHKKVIKKLIRK